MRSVKIKILGIPGIWIDGHKIELPFKKAEGIVYYLAIEKKTTRDSLVNLFWCDVQDDIAKKNLRNAFYMIRKVMGLDLFLMPNRTYVELSQDIELDTDYVKYYEGDINAFTGEFLEGFIVKDAENFETWAIQTREHMKEHYISRLYDLIQNSEDDRLVKEYCKRILVYDEFDEAIYRRLMKTYLQQQRFNKSIELYKQLEKLLREELGIAPDSQSQALYEETNQLKNEFAKEIKTNTDLVHFYGRQHEIEKLWLNHQAMHHHQGTSILLSGDAGIGKTAIVSNFISKQSKEVVVLKATCYQAEEDFTLRPWDEIMRQLAKKIPELSDLEIPPLLRRILSQIFPTFIDETSVDYYEPHEKLDFSKTQVLDKAVFELFDLIADHCSLIMIFEDVHWIDSLSLSLIKHFILNEKNRRFYMVLTTRFTASGQSEKVFNELSRHGLLTEIQIKGFTQAETFDVLKPYVALGKLTSEQMTLVFKETEGNALFLFEFINSLMDGQNHNELSSKIKDVLHSRTMSLSEEARKVLNIISVFFDIAPLQQIIATSEMNELALADVLEELIQQRLIREIQEESSDVVFQFTHQKLREFVYKELSHSKRRILCRRLGHIIEATLNNNHTDRVQYSKLVHYFNQSGDRLLELKYRLAYLHDYLQVTHETFPIVCYLNGTTTVDIPLSEEVVFKELEIIEALFDNVIVSKSQQRLLNELKMEFAHIMGRYWIKIGEFEKGLMAIDELIELATLEGHTGNVLKGYTQKIFYTINAHHLNAMKLYIDEAMSLSGDYPLEHHVYMRLKGLYLVIIGHFEAGENQLRTALCYFKGINRRGEYTLNIAACYYYLGESQRLQGNYKEAIEHFENAIALCKSQNLVGRLTIFYTHAGHAAFDLKDYIRAQKFFEEAIILYKTYDFRWGRSTASGFLGLLELMDGYYKEALQLFQAADEYASRFNNIYEKGILRRIKAEACHYLIRNRVRYVPILHYIGLDLSVYCDLNGLPYQDDDQGFRIDVIEKLNSLRDVKTND